LNKLLLVADDEVDDEDEVVLDEVVQNDEVLENFLLIKYLHH
jgi:hypothetical protein